jgi:hypothetical protein
MLVTVYNVAAPTCIFWCTSSANVEPESFIVNIGDSQEDIIKRLEEQGFIKSEMALKLLFTIKQDYSSIKGGEYKLSKSMDMQDIYEALHQPPEKIWVYIPSFKEIDRLGAFLAEGLGWQSKDQKDFASTYRFHIHKHYKEKALEILSARNSWTEAEKKIALQIYDSLEYDLLNSSYTSGNYLIPLKGTGFEVADMFYAQNAPLLPASITLTDINGATITRFKESIQDSFELIPDIVPFVAKEIQVIQKEGRTYLIFSSSYWNQGRGPLELKPGSRDESFVGDIRTNIYQRIYRTDGTYRSRLAGQFLWHDIHDHYHFEDFMDYKLEPVDVDLKTIPVVKKTGFCIRDRDFIEKLENSPANKKYIDCSTDIQGVSVGYGDTYRYHLADQDIDITNFPKGNYRLTFDVNSGNYFDEMRSDNNSSSVEIYIDPAKLLVQVKN